MALSPDLASMTGFARERAEAGQVAILWEVKSLNGRGLDVRLRLPAGHDGLEPALREAAARVLRRGTVTATLTLTRAPGSSRPTLDEAALEAVLTMIERIRHRLGAAAPVSAEAVLALPGVLRAPTVEEDEAAMRSLEAAIQATFMRAIESLAAARREEGARLGAVLSAKLDEIAALIAAASRDAASQPGAVRDRLLDSLRCLGDQVPALPEDRLVQEVALLAARADVREEIDRLESHLAAARALLSEGVLIGRRLDFLTQEFNREANTLCSKSASPSLTATGLALKAAIEQFREQVQNLE